MVLIIVVFVLVILLIAGGIAFLLLGSKKESKYQYVVEDRDIWPSTQDSGASKFMDIEGPDESEPFFVRLASSDPSRKHTVFNQFAGKKLRVTIQVLED